jgi:outer membrane immunogenic protein
MKLRFITLIAALLGSMGVAQSADLPARVQAPPPVVAPIYNWNGFYIGANGGYGWSGATVDVGGLEFSGGDLKGPFAGGQIGYNFQSGQWVFGVEVDGQWANINETYVVPGTIIGTVTFEDKINWFFTARGRLGVAVQNVLFYGTGGYAHIGMKSSVSNGGVTLSVDDSRGGWTAGGGIEYGFSNWSAKVEYLYLQTFDKDENLFGQPFTWNVHVHTVKFGLNYRFGGGGPVVARY